MNYNNNKQFQRNPSNIGAGYYGKPGSPAIFKIRIHPESLQDVVGNNGRLVAFKNGYKTGNVNDEADSKKPDFILRLDKPQQADTASPVGQHFAQQAPAYMPPLPAPSGVAQPPSVPAPYQQVPPLPFPYPPQPSPQQAQAVQPVNPSSDSVGAAGTPPVQVVPPIPSSPPPIVLPIPVQQSAPTPTSTPSTTMDIPFPNEAPETGADKVIPLPTGVPE